MWCSRYVRTPSLARWPSVPPRTAPTCSTRSGAPAAIEDVTDDEVVAGIRLLARTEGVFAETAGGVTVACARKLLETGQLDPDAETVLLITGDGLKTLDAISAHVGPLATVAPSAKAVREALAR